MNGKKTLIPPVDEKTAIAQVAHILQDVVSELKQTNQLLYAISEELTRGSHKPRP